MSREIDLEQELSDEDRQFLQDRGETEKLRINAMHMDEQQEQRLPVEVGQTPGLDDTGMLANTGDMGPADPEIVEEGVEVMKSGEAADEDDEDDEYDDYEDRSNEALRNEIRKRNTDRDAKQQMPTGGNKADLVATLRKDDEASRAMSKRRQEVADSNDDDSDDEDDE